MPKKSNLQISSWNFNPHRVLANADMRPGTHLIWQRSVGGSEEQLNEHINQALMRSQPPQQPTRWQRYFARNKALLAALTVIFGGASVVIYLGNTWKPPGFTDKSRKLRKEILEQHFHEV
ncbi:unnamed protein product [Vitrella brassicaformis CCMP3155]|uniref:Uncharacterized protein n=2 Tax=Vitrella brassicaformis TaxID=1169539 RepID=A0A0G4FF96_VITBC|nr:unnamed protein product [Vitrella brassicaformis CCMP3155]|mmetsp:Transcript_7175/g.17453  ORF Transcript_7175/g.17453 Transcript_7175/m.17453 type:complete len:120 (+) Transcript_7175:100-459(+)|eukprot:CEM11748.1 unnamed protein product [Vitrella brassicaformis CCMP3155]